MLFFPHQTQGPIYVLGVFLVGVIFMKRRLCLDISKFHWIDFMAVIFGFSFSGTILSNFSVFQKIVFRNLFLQHWHHSVNIGIDILHFPVRFNLFPALIAKFRRPPQFMKSCINLFRFFVIPHS